MMQNSTFSMLPFIKGNAHLYVEGANAILKPKGPHMKIYICFPTHKKESKNNISCYHNKTNGVVQCQSPPQPPPIYIIATSGAVYRRVLLLQGGFSYHEDCLKTICSFWEIQFGNKLSYLVSCQCVIRSVMPFLLILIITIIIIIFNIILIIIIIIIVT